MVARVYIWNQLVGMVAWDEARGYAVFEFDADFVKGNLDLAPLHMPLEQARNNRIFYFPGLNADTFKGLPGLLADSLPDNYGNALIDAWLARQGRNPQSVTPVERLCFIGTRGMGALEFQPSKEPQKEKSEALEIEDLLQIAREMLQKKASLNGNLNRDKLQAIKSIIKVGTSAGGARAKAIIAFNETTGEVRSGQLPTDAGFENWIIKFDGVLNEITGDPQGYGRIEYAYHKMAVAAGIEMTECRLLEENDRAHFMTRRFDRIENEKLHLQSLCGIAHFDYNNPNLYSYEQAFQVMRQLRLPYSQAEQFYMRMVFNVMARNQDDHTKNIAFLMQKNGDWKLSPAFDVTYAYNPEKGWTMRHQMSVNGKRENIEKDDLIAVAKAMNIKKPTQLIEQISVAIKNWKLFAEMAGVPYKQAKAIQKTHIVFK